MTQAEEVRMFGETIEEMTRMKPSYYSNLMYAMAILSDAQEVILLGGTETARQYINKAKYFISEEESKT